jgi:hypothetical protein
MAVEQGTATDYLDLLAKLRIFLTGMAVNPWTVLRNTLGGTISVPTGELIMRAPGAAGTDQIFVGIMPFANATADYYDWRLAGFTGFDNSLAWGAQPGVMQNVFLTLWNAPIPYTFIGNGRRVIIIAKISTFQCSAYLGFINQYASPAQYPYPLAIGGNMAHGQEPAFNLTDWRWSTPDNRNHNFPHSNSVNTFGTPANTYQLRLRSPAGVWLSLRAGDNGTYGDYNIWPYTGGMGNLQQNLGPTAQSPILPIILSDSTPEVYGEFDGVGATSGQNIGAEDLLTVGADSWFVVQDVFRTTRDRYSVARLV